MSYQVLARKYRPRTFDELVGQEHVSRALSHALDQDRLHHAYLFTGTRGVGKTTIARILARCLNCEEGISSHPCGVCPTCQEIGEGRFVDLIEVDAASRTKVEDTRELLENVQYAPTRGRYKVYLIDEVHMLSAHSFNALLKTLEEPPPHVKFLLATTDPQRMPVTVLSRCLQFSLKALPAEQIAAHLHKLLEREMIRFEEPALLALGRAAQGSMRDALSLTDQAIAFGGENLTSQAVAAMLGTVDRAHVRTLLRALSAGEARPVLEALATVAEHAPDELALLDELIAALHELAVIQILGGESFDADMAALAAAFTAEQIQLDYEVALRGRRDVQDAPDTRAALEMILLRMVVFSPRGVLSSGARSGSAVAGGTTAGEKASGGEARGPAKKPETPPSAPAVAGGAGEIATPLRALLDAGDAAAAATPSPDPASAPSPVAEPAPAPSSVSSPAPTPAPQPAAPKADRKEWPGGETSLPGEAPGREVPDRKTPSTERAVDAPAVEAPPAKSPPRAQQPEVATPLAPLAEPAPGQETGSWWAALVERLPLDGTVRNLARNAVLAGRSGDHWTLRLSSGHQVLVNDERSQELAGALSDYFQRRIRLAIEFGDQEDDTPEALEQQQRRQRLAEVRARLLADGTVQALIEQFNGKLDENSIRLKD